MKKILTISALSLTCLLSGCATNSALNEQTNAMNQKLDQLSAQLNDMKSQHEQMMNKIRRNQQNSERANDRLDNIASHYKK